MFATRGITRITIILLRVCGKGNRKYCASFSRIPCNTYKSIISIIELFYVCIIYILYLFLFYTFIYSQMHHASLFNGGLLRIFSKT